MRTQIHRLFTISALSLALSAAAGCEKETEKEKETEGAEESSKATEQTEANQASQAPGAEGETGGGFGDAAGEYEVDPVHSAVHFKVKHIGLGYVHGLFNDVSGSYVLAEDPSESEVTIEVDPNSLFTGDKKRDDDVKGPDILNVKQYPTFRFASTEVEPVEEGRYRVSGELELHGEKNPATIELQHIGSGDDPWGGYRTGFEATFTIDRADYGMGFSSETVGEKIHATVAVEGTKK